MSALDSLSELNAILEQWNSENATAGFATSDPVPKLKRLSEIVEYETEAYYKMDPDPFDDRHPGRANPTCTLGHLFKALLKNEDFMNRVVCEYLLDPHGNQELVDVSARFLYGVLPGVEKKDVFIETEGLVEQLIKWAEEGAEPIRSYATGLLAGAMELQDVASNFKEKNSILVPVMLDRLHLLQKEMHAEFLKDEASRAEETSRHFSMFGSPNKSPVGAGGLTFISPKGKRSTNRSPAKFEHTPVILSPTISATSNKVDLLVNNLETMVSQATSKETAPIEDNGEVNGADAVRDASAESSGAIISSPCDNTSDKSKHKSSSDNSPTPVHKSTNVYVERQIGSKSRGSGHGAIVSYSQTPCSSKDIDGSPDGVRPSTNLDSVSVHRDSVLPPSHLDGVSPMLHNSESLLPSSATIHASASPPSRNIVSPHQVQPTGLFQNPGPSIVSASPSKSVCPSKSSNTSKALSLSKGVLAKLEATAVSTKSTGLLQNVDTGRASTGDTDSEDEGRGEDITVEERRARLKRTLSPSFYNDDVFRLKKQRVRDESFMLSDVSNSSWAEIQPYVIGSYSLEPLTLGMKQRLILQYLTPMGEYQELISAAFEHRAMDLVFYYINLKYNRDVRLAFEALKYLAVLLCHKKFAIEFLNRGGVQKLLDVYRPSIAATGVSLCLYYLSYFEDAMERVCLLSDHVLTTLVNYVLWLLECSHDSSRCHAAMFFMLSFSFVVILHKFDANDGIRRLYNVVSTLEIMNIESSTSPNEDQVFTMRQCARHVCVALKKYFESHLILKVNELKRLHAQSEGGSPHHEVPVYKSMKISADHVQENIELLMELMPVRQQWHPEATFSKLGGISLLTQLVAMSPDWSNYTGKPETIKAALDVVSVCCATPKSQLQLLESIPLPQDIQTPAISVFIGLAEGDTIQDSDVQKSALAVIINCVCGPIERLGGGVGRYMGSGSKKKINWKLGEDVLSKMWNGVRENNGIMVLLKLLTVKTPITDADSLRALACKALVGMARSETVRQIISKLPLFSSGQLQSLMKEPVLQDKRLEHVKFCKYATELIEKVSGKQTHRYSDATLDDIRKADIVAQSKIIFNEKELLQLMYDYLQSKGLHDSAEVLQREASLVHCSTPPPQSTTCHMPSQQLFAPIHASPTGNALFSPTVQSSILTPRALHRQMSQPQQSGTLSATLLLPVAVANQSSGGQNLTLSAPTSGSSQAGSSTPQLHGGPIRFSMSRQVQQPQTPTTSSSSLRNLAAVQPRCKYVKEKDPILFSPALRRELQQRTHVEYEISLDKIVTEYLRKQHALCRNPVVTCPPMSLFQPHRCPEPRGSSSAPVNFTARTIQKMLQPKFGGYDGRKLDRKFIYSRFKPIRTYKDSEDDGFSCCTFANTQTTQQYLMIGTYGGNLKLINTQSTEETGSFHCHASPLTHVEHSRDGKLVLTASSYGIINCSALWSWGSETLDNQFNFEDNHLEFSQHVQDRLIGTKDEVANLYDITTGEKIVQFYDAEKANNYKTNRAIFNPSDDLVLNDGVLWDVRSAKAIHKFDKFNQYVSGVFHPIGLEIIINSEIWDIRSFRLLHTVPALDQCQIRFNYMGDVMYATHIDEELDSETEKVSPFGSTFRTFDTTNYSLIATIDVKSRSISDLATDTSDTYLAVVECMKNTQAQEISSLENICRLYEIGKIKDEADDQQNEEEEEEAVEDDDEDDDDDDDDHDEFMLAEDLDTDSNNEEEVVEGGSDFDSDIEVALETDSDEEQPEEEAEIDDGNEENEEDEEGEEDDDDDDIDLDGIIFELA